MKIMQEIDYMRLALSLAQAAKGQTGANPLVGAVVVNGGHIVGMGAHLRLGEAHAEVNALNMAGHHAENSTVYVSLEPCSHFGRTPPCANRLIQDRVKRVVIATLDPNPRVAGNGVRLLREAGIKVEVGMLQEEAMQMNEMFHKYITTGLPFVTLKAAMTLDGKIATVTGHSRWISGVASRKEVHRYRHEYQAIMVGIGTVLSDDPELTTRMEIEGIHPIRVIVDSKLSTPLYVRVVRDGNAQTIILTTLGNDPNKIDALTQAGVKVIEVNQGERVDVRLALTKLAELGISSILLEGGATLAGTMLEHRLIDKMILYIAPKIVGGHDAPQVLNMNGVPTMNEAITFRHISYEQIDGDLRFIGYPQYELKL